MPTDTDNTTALRELVEAMQALTTNPAWVTYMQPILRGVISHGFALLTIEPGQRPAVPGRQPPTDAQLRAEIKIAAALLRHPKDAMQEWSERQRLMPEVVTELEALPEEYDFEAARRRPNAPGGT